MMLLRAKDNNIQSFAFIWLYKRNQNKKAIKNNQNNNQSKKA